MNPLRPVLGVLACRRGAALPEFGLVLPVLVVLLIGLADFGAAMYEDMDVRAASRAGVQHAVHNPTDTAGIEQTVLQALGGAPDGTTVATTLFCECADASTIDCSTSCPDGEAPRRFIRVEVTRPHALLIPYPGVGSEVELHGESIFRLQ